MDGEQAQYAQLRERLLRTLSKVGICSDKNARPLTNVNANRISREERGSMSEEEDEEEALHESNRRSLSHNRSGSEYGAKKSKSSTQPSASKEYRSVMAHLKDPIVLTMILPAPAL